MHFSYEGQVRTLPADPENTSNDPLLDAMEMDSPSLMEMDSPTHYLHVMMMDSSYLMEMVPLSPGEPFSQSLLARL